MAEIDEHLDALFGSQAGCTRPEAPRFLQRLAEALTPIDVAGLWLVDSGGKVCASWTASGANEPSTRIDQIRREQSFAEQESGIGWHIEDQQRCWFWMRDVIEGEEGGVLLGIIASDVPDSTEPQIETLQSFEHWLRVSAWLAFREAIRADAVPLLNVRLEQLTRQHLAFRHEYQQMVAQALEERDARIQEQQSYLERLEDEVADRTRELSEQTARLERAYGRMKRDLEAAGRIQQALLPSSAPPVTGLEFAWRYRPCDELGGDSLNVFQLDEQTIGMYVLDVSGHGVPAALLSVTLSRVLSPLLDHASILKFRSNNPKRYTIRPPGRVADKLNEQFPMDASTEQYFTILYGTIDLETLEFQYVSAGHPGFVHIAPAGPATVHESPGFPIGWVEDATYKTHSIKLASGDRLYLYSDGIVEAPDARDNAFGIERLKATFAESRSRTLDECLTRVVDQVTRWCGDQSPVDDLSILAVNVK